ncbi:MAG: ECF transporter S component [Niameybacter sp.]
MRIRNLFIFISIALLDIVLLTLSFKYSQYFFLLSTVMIILSMYPVVHHFEKRPLQAEEVILIAVLSALGAVARIPFTALPSIQPTSFIIILTGVIFGGEIGFLVGALSALSSNLVLGQGPWTLWQMFAWSMMGLSSGLFAYKTYTKAPFILCTFGFIWGFLFGWIMNIWSVVSFFDQFTLALFATSMATSLYFDLAHGLSNVFFLLVFSKAWFQILGRVRIKYGLFSV